MPFQLATPLLAHQRAAVAWGSERTNCFVFDRPGCGKSYTALALVQAAAPPARRALIVCPSVSVDVWCAQIATHTRNAQVLALRSAAQPVTRDQLVAADLVVVSFATLLRAYKRVPGATVDLERRDTSSRHHASPFAANVRYDRVAQHALDPVLSISENCTTTAALVYAVAFPLVIIDECHALRTLHSRRFRAAVRLCAQRRILLSGTPIHNNNVEEVYCMMRLAHVPALVPFHVYKRSIDAKAAVRHRTFVEQDDGTLVEGESVFDAGAFAQRTLNEIVLARTEDDIAEATFRLPPLDEHDEIAPTFEHAAERDVYARCEKDMCASYRALQQTRLGGGASRDLSMRVQQRLLLARQVTTAVGVPADYVALLGDHADGAWAHEDGTKMRMLRAYLRQLVGQPTERVVVFFHFLRAMSIAERVCTSLGLRYVRVDGRVPAGTGARQTAIETFAGRAAAPTLDGSTVQVLLAQISTMGESVNGLQYACNRVVFMSPWYNPQVEYQALRRVQRMGQAHDVVHVTRLLVDGTIDMHVRAIALAKTDLLQRLRNGEFYRGSSERAGGGAAGSAGATGATAAKFTLKWQDVVRRIVARDDAQAQREAVDAWLNECTAADDAPPVLKRARM